MKRNGKAWTFFALQIVFMLVIPCAFVWLQYGEVSEGYKVSMTAIVCTIIVFILFKKIFLAKWLKTIDGKILNIETTALTITDENAINANKRAWRIYSVVQFVINAVVPLLCFFLAVETIKIVEQGLIKLYGCLMFCLLSIALGAVFRVLEIMAMRFTHEKE